MGELVGLAICTHSDSLQGPHAVLYSLAVNVPHTGEIILTAEPKDFKSSPPSHSISTFVCDRGGKITSFFNFNGIDVFHPVVFRPLKTKGASPSGCTFHSNFSSSNLPFNLLSVLLPITISSWSSGQI